MDTSLITLLNQKKNVFKTVSLKASELTLSKSLKTDSNITCNRLICDIIEINPGIRQELKEVDIYDSTLNSTEIGLEEPSIAKFTKIEIDSLSNPTEAFKTDGDIHVSGTFLNEERKLKSDNPYKLEMLSSLKINSLENMFITTDKSLNIVVIETIELKSNILLNINTNKIVINSQTDFLNTNESSSFDNGSVVIKGGVGIEKNLNIASNFNIQSENEISFTCNGGVLIHKNLNLEGNLNISNSTENSINLQGGMSIGKNINLYGNFNLNNNDEYSMILRGGMYIKKNINIEGDINNNNLNVGGQAIIQKNANIGGILNLLNTSEDSLNVNGGMIIHKNTNIYGNLNLLQTANIKGGLAIEGTTDMSNINIKNNATINDSIIIKKNTIIGNLNLSSASIYDNNGTIEFNNNNLNEINNLESYNSTILHNLNVNNNVNIEKSLIIKEKNIIGNLNLSSASIYDNNGTIEFNNNNLKEINDLESYNSTILHNLNVNNNVNIEKSLIVNHNSIFKSSIKVSNNSCIGTLHLGDSFIEDSNNLINFGNTKIKTNTEIECKNLNVIEGSNFNGQISAQSGSSIGDLLFSNGMIEDSSKNISFTDNNLSTTGNLNINNITSTNLIKSNELVVYGNFTVNGNTSILNTTNAVIYDNLIELNHNLNTNPINDSGLLINRGNKINAFMGWKENQEKFILGTTTQNSYSTGDININKGTLLANLIGNLNGDSGSNIGSLTFVNGSITDSSGQINFQNNNLNTIGLVTSNNLIVNNNINTNNIKVNTHSQFNNIIIKHNSITSINNLINFDSTNLKTTGIIECASNSKIGTLKLSNGSITDSTSIINFGNNKLTTTGIIEAATNSKIGTLTLSNGSITDSSSIIDFGNNKLITTGIIETATNSKIGTLTLSNGSITDSNSIIDFGNNKLITTGIIETATNSKIGTLTLSNGSITDSNSIIDFGNNTLITSNTIEIGTLRLNSGSITNTNSIVSFGNNTLTTTGVIEVAENSKIGTLTLSNGSITDSNGTINFNDEDLITTGIVRTGNLVVQGDMIINGNTTTVNTENIVINDNIIGINNGITNTPINDSGLIINRGNLNNMFFGYKENLKKFILGSTNANNTSTGNINVIQETLLSNIEGDIIGNITGNSLLVIGNSVLNKNLDLKGDLMIADDKFIVNSNNGDTIIKGDLNIGNNSVIFNKNTGNTVINGIINGKNDVFLDKNLTINQQCIIKDKLELIATNKLGLKVYGDSNLENVIINNNLNIGSNNFTINPNGFTKMKSDLIVDKTIITNNINTQNILVNHTLTAKIGIPTDDYDTNNNNLELNQNLLIPDAFKKIEKWIITNLIDTPPAPTNTNNTIIINNHLIEFDWIIPIQYYVGFLNRKLPEIISIGIDYKKSSDLNYTKINTNNETIIKLRAHAFNLENSITNNIYNLYNIEKETEYDFRIYCINNNTIRPIKYLYFNNLKTTQCGIPSKINFIGYNNITTNSANIFWNHPSLLDIINNTNNQPKIKQYNITYKTISSLKYPNYITQDINTINISNIINNANNTTELSNLLEGHTYELKIKSKNIINNDYSEESEPIYFTTNINTNLSFINNNNIYIKSNHNYTFNNHNYGYSLNGLHKTTNLFDYNKLDTNFETNTINDLRINENIASTELQTSMINVELNEYTSNLNINGFGITTNSKINNNINIIVNDFKNNDGFFKSCDLKVNFNNNIIINSPHIKKININQYLPFSKTLLKSKSYDFYIDDANTYTTLSNVNINLKNDYNIDYISGVPIFLEGNFNIDMISNNLTNNFLRHDKKHFDLVILNNNTTITNNLNLNHDYIKNQNYYYNLNNSLHNDGKTIIPNTNQLLFKNIIVNFNNNNNHYSENLNVGITTHNLFGSSNQYHFKPSKNIRIDNLSYNTKIITSNQNSHYGKHVFSGGNDLYQYDPNIDLDKLNIDQNNINIIENFNINYNQTFILNSNNYIHYNQNLSLIKNVANTYNYNLNVIYNNNQHNYVNIDNFYIDFNNNISNIKLFGIDYNHNKNINTMNEIQLIKGTYQIQKKIDYSNYINYDLITYPNYINTPENFNQNKYITFKYSNIINNSNKITIEFLESQNITNENISLHLKIYNNNKYTTGWLNCNKYISMMGINDYNKVFDNTGILSLNQSSTIKKYCYLPIASNGILYLRCGIKHNTTKIKFIKISNGFI